MNNLCSRLLDAEQLLLAIERAFHEREDTVPKLVLDARRQFDALSSQDVIQESEIIALEELFKGLAADYLD